MRVVHLSYIIPKPKFADPEKWLTRISFSVAVLERLANHAEITSIYHIHYRGEVHRNNVTYHFTNYNRIQLLLPFRFHRYLRKLRPDAVVVHGLITPWQILLLRWQLGPELTVVVEHHAERPLKDFRQYLQRWADRYIKAYLFGSTMLGKQWVEKKQIKDEGKIKEIVGTSSIFYPIEREVAKNTTGVMGGVVYLWVGRMDVNKDPGVVVRAFDRFARTRPECTLYMIYSAADAEFNERDIISAMGEVTSQVHFVGEVVHDELLYWYNSADFIISSSHYEGNGIAVCEALSCGCIPILTNIPSFIAMANEGRLGLLYPPGNEDALLAALDASLILDRSRFKNQALDWYRTHLSGEAIAKKIMEVISRVSNG